MMAMGTANTLTDNLLDGMVVASNDFVVRYKGAVLTAHRGWLNLNTGDIVAEGAVNLQEESQVWSGERLEYNFNTRQIHAERFRTGRAPLYATGEVLTCNRTNNTYTANNAFVTTDQGEPPGCRSRARRRAMGPREY